MDREKRIEEIKKALLACATETPTDEYPCAKCYLYPKSNDGRMSTGRTCFQHLALDTVDALKEMEAAGYGQPLELYGEAAQQAKGEG